MCMCGRHHRLAATSVIASLLLAETVPYAPIRVIRLYDVCDKSGNIDNIAYFDASYFGVHQQQAYYMDPMQRMVLEKSFEALIDAGINPVEARGKSIGVYMSSTINENDSAMFENVDKLGACYPTEYPTG
ncbi:Fatty acid synthase 3 [Carabus blaptoides fortunei]